MIIIIMIITIKIMITVMMMIVTDLILTDSRQARGNGWAVNLEKKRKDLYADSDADANADVSGNYAMRI